MGEEGVACQAGSCIRQTSWDTLGLEKKRRLCDLSPVPDKTYRWFRDLGVVRAENDGLVILAKDEFERVFVEPSFAELKRFCVENQINRPVDLQFGCMEGKSDET